ncbi:DUF4422 domain-containing protein [Planococcus alpniumensis]|uniref:DUF4422 domain-containing protein n=1 Tax=Planococcus alpniumensis TaxID=2708345 RepID=UPI001B8D3006|nr:DUF4422 domain-containing protein [Planococcus sp. MSAK28401]
MSDIKILVATHKKYAMPMDDIYLPIHVGKEGKEDIGFQGDNTGENISNKNSNYCELTGLYWAWKNLDCEYIGMSHYRRYFTTQNTLKRLFGKREKIETILNKEEILEYCKKFDVILPVKRNYYIETVWSHYGNAHYIKDLEETKKIIEEIYPSYTDSFNTVVNRKKIYLYNMFVMKKSWFDEYSEWLFNILFELEKRTDMTGYDKYQQRIYGFISERLFNVWLEEKTNKVKELNVYNLEGTEWLGKVRKFILRKLVGQKSERRKLVK